MRILHIIPTLSKKAGGPTEVAIHLVKNLNQLGAKAEILTTDDDGDQRLHVKLKELTDFRGVPVRFFSRLNPRLKEFIISPQAIQWLSVNLHQYDILDIHYLFSFVPMMARRMARKRKFPYTVRTMGQLSPWALQQSKIKKQILFQLQEFKNLQHADALHSTSRGEEGDIRAFGLDTPVINIPLGVNKPKAIENASQTIREKYKIGLESFILLFLSRLHYKKRPDLLIEVMHRLGSTHKAHLVIAGTGETAYELELKRMVERYRLNAMVTFAGFVTGQEKDELLQGSDLFVLPSFSENFGVAVAESMAAGTPVVITPEVQISEYIERYQAGVVTSGNVDSVLRSIIGCMYDNEAMANYKRNGLKLVDECFNWNVIAAELIRSYHSLVNKPKY